MEYNYQSPWFIEALQKEGDLKINDYVNLSNYLHK